MTDLPEKTADLPAIAALAKDLYHCAACNYCVDLVWSEWGIDHVCPTVIHHSPSYGYAGLGYISQARAWYEGETLPFHSLAERAFTCTTCGNCEEVCPIGIRPAHVVLALRNELNARGATPAAFAQMRENVLAEDNPAGHPRAQRHAWAETLGDAQEGARLLFVPGCAACYAVPDEARACADLLMASGWRVEMLGAAPGAEETCCGAPLHEAGFAVDAAGKGQRLRQQIAAAGAGDLAVLGAECLEALAERHPSAGDALDLPPRHPIELVLEAVRTGRLVLTARPDRPLPQSIGYLDPCHLTKKSHGAAAQGGLATAARELLALVGCEVGGEARAARFAVCCGAAGGMPDMQPEAARRMGAAKLDEFAGRDAVAVVTASPLCLSHLRHVREPGQPQVFGLFEFLHSHFTPSSANRESGR